MILSALKKLGSMMAGRTGSLDLARRIVNAFRFIYIATATTIGLTWYSAWRNERVEPGKPKFPFPGVKKLRPRFAPFRADDIPAGYSGPTSKGVSMSSGSAREAVVRGQGKAGPPEYGGTRQVAEALLAGLQGLTHGSTKRSTQSTSSGGVSDHWTGCQECYAIDAFGSTSHMDAGARQVISRLGGHYKSGELVHTVERNGFRIQVLYRTMVGGDHFTHIHVGVRKVGYTP
jgi:hypothetical protein